MFACIWYIHDVINDNTSSMDIIAEKEDLLHLLECD